MGRKSYRLRFLPLFEHDLNEVVDYIQFHLKNHAAAERFVDAVEDAIRKRLQSPEIFEPYYSARERLYPYYRIYVKNYIVFYVVIDDIMEVRRLVYHKRMIDEYI